jgi:hypothetical protein
MKMSAPYARLRWLPAAGLLVLTLSGCDMLGIETPGMVNAKKEAEGKAIGAACRHAIRSIEDCHNANPRVSKSAIFEGWREMDAYMRENELEGMPPTSPAPPPAPVVTPPQEVILPPSGPTVTPPATPPPATGSIQLPPRPSIAPTR